MRWTMDDPVALDSWTLPRNPYEMQTPTLQQRTTVMPGSLAFRHGQVPSTWGFKGRLHTKDEYDTMLNWSRRPNAIRITDHVGRILLVIPQHFDPVPQRSRRFVSWRFDYTFTGLYLGRGTP